MKLWIISAVVIGLLVIAGFAAASLLNNDVSESPASTSKCCSQSSSCTAESNCGRATCGAAAGTGSCGCNKG